MPNLWEYYYSTQIRYIVYWCSPDYQASWKHIELGTEIFQPQAKLGEKQNFFQKEENTIAQETLKIWNEIVKKIQIGSRSKFRPGLGDKSLQPNSLHLLEFVEVYCVLHMECQSSSDNSTFNFAYHLALMSFFITPRIKSKLLKIQQQYWTVWTHGCQSLSHPLDMP